ncbi:MAG: FAD:protein FMN transferase [Cyclobacteriaceae bacterium]|jgi:thiamine biosynthesis lipoprotein|nr:FAD:protein FMN transferase [Cyclobacteriaceae bacterium]
MSNRVKNSLYSIVLVAAVAIVWWWRNRGEEGPIRIEGATMGTTYNITYFDNQGRDFKPAVDSLLAVVNQAINTYDIESEISRFNQAERGLRLSLPYLLPPLRKAQEIALATQGAFDPTVMPLVNHWGFGYQKATRPDSSKLDSIRAFVGFEKIQFSPDSLWKSDPRVQLDFGGIGQGYGADVVTAFLRQKGIANMLVEIGGEGMAVGINLSSGKPWEIGILDPNSTRDSLFFKAYVALENQSFTTSGNYFNYRVVDGKKYSHTIHPQTGFPVEHSLLSASVFAQDATTADGWATALMVMGTEKAIAKVKATPSLEAFLIYSDSTGRLRTFATEKISSRLKINP